MRMKTRSYTHLVFVAAMVLLAAMTGWWSVFLWRAVNFEREASLREIDLRRELAHEDPGKVEEQVRAIEERHHRRSAMVMGEGALLAGLVGVCMFMLARMLLMERRQTESMRVFISTVTHEMKTPITGVKTLLQTIAAGKVRAGEQAELLAMGLAQADRLDHLVENVLIAGRMRVDEQPVRMLPAEIGEVLDAFESHRRLLMADEAALEVRRDDEVRRVQVLCDPDAVRVVLDNLVDNAFKYGGDGLPVVVVEARALADGACIDVSDKGRGFETADSERIFEPFFRLMERGSRAEHGTGLGLGIARSLARRMGGDVTARSDGPGKGSTFTVTLTGRPR